MEESTYDWNLKDIFENEDTFKNEMEKLKGDMEKIVPYKGRLNNSVDEFNECFKLMEESYESFEKIYNALLDDRTETSCSHDMVGYVLRNTLTENGTVSRGVCSVDDNDYLPQIVERTKIKECSDGAAYLDEDGETWIDISPESIVSMNLWGFKKSIIEELGASFEKFLTEEMPLNPLKSEFFLPTVVQQLLKADRADVKVLQSKDKWFGVTYKEDKEKVVEAIAALKAQGVYPEYLWRK